MSDAERTADTRLATMALLAQTGTARGAPPADDELVAWAEQRLDGARLSEVESHIAHDPAVFERAMVASDRAGKAAPVKAGGPSPTRTLYALAATVLVGALMALVLNDAPPRSADVDDTVRAARPAPAADWRIAAFRAGVAGAERPPVFDAGAPCVDPDCGALTRTLFAYGQRLARFDGACQRGGTVSPADAAALAQTRDVLAASFELVRWQAPLDAAIAPDGALSCADVRRLIDQPME